VVVELVVVEFVVVELDVASESSPGDGDSDVVDDDPGVDSSPSLPEHAAARRAKAKSVSVVAPSLDAESRCRPRLSRPIVLPLRDVTRSGAT